MFEYKNFFEEDTIEQTSKHLLQTLPSLRSWEGCTRLDIAVEIGVTVEMLERAMSSYEQLDFFIRLIEQKTLLNDVHQLKDQVVDRKTNSKALQMYYAMRHGMTEQSAVNRANSQSRINALNINVNLKERDVDE